MGVLISTACGSSSSGGPDGPDGPGGPDAGPQVPPDSQGGEDAAPPVGPEITFTCPGGTPIMAGANQIEVGGRNRTFYVDLPEDTSGPVGLVFSWHGYGDTAPNFRTALALDPDAVPGRPMVIVTPEDSGMNPPSGLDWDIAKGTVDHPNRDLAFFEAMVGCFNDQFTLDTTGIYSVGFSAGSVMTNLIHSRYPELVSTIISISGAWFNDQAQIDLVNLFNIDWTWPQLDPADGGTVLLTHGGPSDVTVLNILDLEASAQAALPFLAAANRLVVDCAHTAGHRLHPEVTPALMMSFLAAHRTGAPSPYETSFDGFPTSCTLRGP